MGLPGDVVRLEDPCVCEDCNKSNAYNKVQGETDSFGAEYQYLCDDCLAKFKDNATPMVGICDWCKAQEVELIPTRDYDEGMSGPVYYVCHGCKRGRK